MISPSDDRILEACLTELLGSEAPPDLTERILRNLPARHQNGAAHDLSVSAGTTNTSHRQPIAPIPLWDVAASQPNPSVRDANVGPSHPLVRSNAVQDSAVRRTWSRPVWLSAVLAASVALAFVGYSISRGPQQPAKDNLAGGAKPGVKPPAMTQQPDQEKPAGPPVAGESLAASSPTQQGTPKSTPENPSAAVSPKPHSPPSTDVVADARPPQSPAANASPVQSRRTQPASSRSDEEIVSGINQQIRRRWEEEGVKPTALATDAEWVRRAYLDILGRIPTYEETNRYLADRGTTKKARLLDRLLESDDCLEEYARNWTNIWSALLVGRSGGQQPGSLVDREGLQQYLRRSFLKNKPYDQFVGELIAADGSNSPGQPDFNGAVNFVLDNLEQNGVSATAKTSRLFLGMQVQCTQCHNHPFNDWKQDQFWEMNAFFRQAKPVITREGNEIANVRLTDVDFAGENGNSLDDAEVYWEMRNGLIKASYPAFVDGTRIAPSGAVAKVNRRDELARLVVQSDLMPQAAVNRMWGHFLGYGFTKPVDDIGPHNPPSHPELLSQLAQDFAGRGFDPKSLIRWIVLSEPYALSSRAPAKSTDDPAAGQTPLFSYFYLRQMRAEELYESLIVATGVRMPHETFEERERVKTSWLQQFTTSFGTEENDECTTFNGSISQTLVMWNGDLVKKATSGDRGSFLHQVAASDSKNVAKINQLFTAALSRKATSSELQLAQLLWQQRKGDTTAALQDLWWAVLNSNEFILNH